MFFLYFMLGSLSLVFDMNLVIWSDFVNLYSQNVLIKTFRYKAYIASVYKNSIKLTFASATAIIIIILFSQFSKEIFLRFKFFNHVTIKLTTTPHIFGFFLSLLLFAKMCIKYERIVVCRSRNFFVFTSIDSTFKCNLEQQLEFLLIIAIFEYVG